MLRRDITPAATTPPLSRRGSSEAGCFEGNPSIPRGAASGRMGAAVSCRWKEIRLERIVVRGHDARVVSTIGPLGRLSLGS